MLIKKELEQIPALHFPKTTAKERQGKMFSASAEVYSLKKSGSVLVVDVFDTKSRMLKLRFFCDGVTYLICEQWPAVKWIKRKPGNVLGHGAFASTKKGDEIVLRFFKKSRSSYYYINIIESYINGFVSDIYSMRQRLAMERKYAMMKEHFAMYPDYPGDLPLFCERHVFDHSYIFVEKVINGSKRAVCGHCNKKFKIKSANSVLGHYGNCPKCGLRAKFRGSWLKNSSTDKACICIAHKHEGQIILRWVKLRRLYKEKKYYYKFEDYYKNLYISTPKGVTIYAYAYIPIMYYGVDWVRKQNGTLCSDKTFIYTNNLKEVFGEKYCYVDLQNGLINVGNITFTGLLNNLQNIPEAEYLFKMGLSTIASNMHIDDLQTGNSFSKVLGVSKQYLPLYRKFNIDIFEHKIIKAANTWVSIESFEKFRALKPAKYDTKDIIDLLERMSFEHFVNYFIKQMSVIKNKKLQYILTLYKDYISMSKQLKVELLRKSVCFPSNIKQSHDLVLARFNKVKHEIQDENFKHASEKLYSGMSEYAKGDFCIVFPRLYSDLVIEGQSLNHCVGSETYYNNHIEGKRMIFFIRRAAEPEKSFVTMEIDMRELRIRQLYGFGGTSPTPDVRRFANDFLRRLSPYENMERIAI